MAHMEARKLFTRSDAARALKVAEATITSWSENGTLPVEARTPSGLRLYDPAIIEQLAKHRAERGLCEGAAHAD